MGCSDLDLLFLRNFLVSSSILKLMIWTRSTKLCSALRGKRQRWRLGTVRKSRFSHCIILELQKKFEKVHSLRFPSVMNKIWMAWVFFVIYFQIRLLYSVCWGILRNIFEMEGPCSPCHTPWQVVIARRGYNHRLDFYLGCVRECSSSNHRIPCLWRRYE